MLQDSRMAGIAEFLSEEKKKAEHRIQCCENFINSEVTSPTLLEGLQTLLQHAEDDYGTLLHLEKVIRMKNSGDHDFKMSAFTSNKRPSAVQSTFGQSLPINYGFSSYKTSNERRTTPKTISFERHSPDEFCGFQFDEEEDIGSEVVHKAFTSLKKPGKTKLDATTQARKKLSVKEEVEEEEEDLFDEDPAAYPSEQIRIRRPSGGDHLGLARSLPLTVPLHKHKLLQKNDDQDDFEDISEIPNKIAELARSVHGGDIFGDLPSPRREQRVG